MLLAKLNVLKSYVNIFTTAAAVVGVTRSPLAIAATTQSVSDALKSTIGSAVPYMDVGNLVLLIVVLVILLVIAQVIKSIRLNPAGRRNKRLKIVDQVLIGNKQRLALVEVDGEAILIGITSSQISFLNKTGHYSGTTTNNSLNNGNDKIVTKKGSIESENWSVAPEVDDDEEEDPDIVTRQRIKLRPKRSDESRQEPRL